MTSPDQPGRSGAHRVSADDLPEPGRSDTAVDPATATDRISSDSDRDNDSDRERGGYTDRDHDGRDDRAQAGYAEREQAGYADRDSTRSAAGPDAQRLDAQDADTRGAPGPALTEPVTSGGTRTQGGYPQNAETVDQVRSAEAPAVHGIAPGTNTVIGGTGGTSGTATAEHADRADYTSQPAAATAAAGAATTGTAQDTASRGGGEQLERLVPQDRVRDYTARWDAVKGEFVDEPRQAVAKADQLVGELLDELDRLFRKQRSDLERGLDADETSTEDLRLALRRYRSFFDRLLAL
jgi:hypothetical protein